MLTSEQLDYLAERVADRLKQSEIQRFVSREEYAEMWQLSTRTIDRAIEEGRLAAERIGRRVLIPRNAKILRKETER